MYSTKRSSSMSVSIQPTVSRTTAMTTTTNVPVCVSKLKLKRDHPRKRKYDTEGYVLFQWNTLRSRTCDVQGRYQVMKCQ